MGVLQVYEKLDDSAQSARYCHATLRRQMLAHRYDVMDWSLNASMLAQYYFSVNDFEMSRHCLASAELVLAETGPQPESLYVPYEVTVTLVVWGYVSLLVCVYVCLWLCVGMFVSVFVSSSTEQVFTETGPSLRVFMHRMR